MTASFRRLVLACALLGAGGTAVSAPVISTFDDLPLAAESFYFPEASTPFVSGAAQFSHRYSDFGIEGCCWNGWSYSNVTDTVTPGFGNQYSAYAGGGAGGSANYGIYFDTGAPSVSFAAPSQLSGAYITNTTYTALSLLSGDGFAKKFGGATGDDPDFFKLLILGMDAAGATTGTVEFYLADYRFADNSQDYVVDTWRFVDLSALGRVSSLAFMFDSSDIGPFGFNTPLYFALDDLTATAVPEPASSVLLLAGALLAFATLRTRGRR